MNKNALLACFMWLASFSASAAESPPSIDDFAFLTGYWKGSGFGGVSEEMWMPPADGRMYGIFKQSGSEGMAFTEFMEIHLTDGSAELRLKHFNPDFTGWEEKDGHVTFPLREVSSGKAVFGGLTYELGDGGESLVIRLDLRNSAGEVHEEVFRLQRITLP